MLRKFVCVRAGLCVLTLAVVAGMGLPSSVRAADASAPSADLWHPWFELGGFYTSRDDDTTSASNGSRGETTLFAPIQGGARDLLFAQLTGKFFEDEAREGNFALGYRHMSPAGVNIGGWIGGDIHRTETGNRFWQLSGGFESLSGPFDVRANWYGPVTDPQLGDASAVEVLLAGTEIFMIGTEEVAMKGIDGEVGVRLPLEGLGLDDELFELRTYAGGFYFDHEDAFEEIVGVKGRLDLRINDVVGAGSMLTASYEVTHDDVRDTRHDVGLRLRISLNGNEPGRALSLLSDQQRRMLDRIARKPDIVTGLSKGEAIEDALTGTDFDRVAFASASTDVSTTSAAAGDNSLVILNGTVTGGQTLQANQTLQGGGATISVRGRRTGVVTTFTAPGAAGRLTAPAFDENNLTLAGSNTHVSGITIVGSGPAGVGDGLDVDSNKSNVFLTNLIISDTAGDGVDIDENNEVTIINLTTRDTDESGVDMNNNNTVSILGASIARTDRDSIKIEDDNVVTIRDVTINGSSVDGIFAEDRNTIDIANTSISNVTEDAINVLSDNTLTVTTSTLSTVPFGLYLEDDGNTATITNTTFSNIGDVAVLIEGRNNVARISGSTFDTVGFDVVGLAPFGPATLFFANNTVTGPVGNNVFTFVTGNTDVEAGSDGNINTATVGNAICETPFIGTFTGSIGFGGGVTLVDNAASCN